MSLPHFVRGRCCRTSFVGAVARSAAATAAAAPTAGGPASAGRAAPARRTTGRRTAGRALVRPPAAASAASPGVPDDSDGDGQTDGAEHQDETDFRHGPPSPLPCVCPPEATPRGCLAHLRVAGMPPPVTAQSRVEQVQSFARGGTSQLPPPQPPPPPPPPPHDEPPPQENQLPPPDDRWDDPPSAHQLRRRLRREPRPSDDSTPIRATAPRKRMKKPSMTAPAFRSPVRPPWAVRDVGMPSRLTGQSRVEQVQRVLPGQHLLTCTDMRVAGRPTCGSGWPREPGAEGRDVNACPGVE